VPNALPGKDSIKHEIIGMEGIPDENAEPPAKRARLEEPAEEEESSGMTPATAGPMPMPGPAMPPRMPTYNTYVPANNMGANNMGASGTGANNMGTNNMGAGQFNPQM
tara:strand:- start:44 stop:367 length:324 start_codon:yes stop_codon:yes gene_type:complete